MPPEQAIFSGAMSPYYSEWNNFQTWLNSAGGPAFYFAVFVAMFILVFLPSLRRNRGLVAVLIWLGLGLLPVVMMLGLIPWEYFRDVEYVMVPLSSIPLIVGLIVLAIPESA